MVMRRWGTVILGLVFLLTVLSFFYTPYRPEQIQISRRLQPPSRLHFFGTDHLGRDIFSRLLVGGRVSLLIGVGAVLLGAVGGIVLGMAAGFVGNFVDELVMRVSDGMQSLPSILLALLFATVWQPGPVVILWAIAVGNIPIFLRLTRNQVLSIKKRPYVEAAQALGNGSGGIIWRHILPNIKDALIVQFSVSLAGAILAESSLSYLGVGIQPPHPSWGGMLREAQAYASMAPWLVVVPGLAIGLTVIGFNLLGSGWTNGR
ncbi:MAG: ABC transporter permease [Firmicutes bacterium]|jgi:peptide/nickel transport system permease protein|nr:ABC transporter permease [Bacillota bacterium]NLO66342.1 ABC transporter permease [Bacillota bacterium]